MCAMESYVYLNEGLKWKITRVRGHMEIDFEGLANVIAQSTSASCHFWLLNHHAGICDTHLFLTVPFFATGNKKTYNAKIKKNCSKMFVDFFMWHSCFHLAVNMLFYRANCADVQMSSIGHTYRLLQGPSRLIRSGCETQDQTSGTSVVLNARAQ